MVDWWIFKVLHVFLCVNKERPLFGFQWPDGPFHYKTGGQLPWRHYAWFLMLRRGFRWTEARSQRAREGEINRHFQLALKPQNHTNRDKQYRDREKIETKSHKNNLCTQRGLRNSSKSLVVVYVLLRLNLSSHFVKIFSWRHNREVTIEGWTRRCSPRVLGEI